ncbi:MAG: hypothetical protein ABFD82_11975 [Syntrophaceae bacterium]
MNRVFTAWVLLLKIGNKFGIPKATFSHPLPHQQTEEIELREEMPMV